MTDGQRRFIWELQETAEMNGAIIPLFTGNTKGEAVEWIGRNKGKAYRSAISPDEYAGDRV